MNEIQKNEHDVHIAVLGWLFVLGNAIFLVLGATALLLLAGIGFASGDAEALRILGVIGTVSAAFLAALALPGLLAGVGLLRRASWARVLALVVGILGLANFPVGTAIGIYAIWVLLHQDAAGVFVRPKAA